MKHVEILPAEAAAQQRAPRRSVEARRLTTRQLFALRIVDATAAPTIARILRPGAPRRVHFVNAHCINVAAQDDAYRTCLASAGDLVLPDGIGLDLAARMQGGGLSANLNGTDLCPQICAEAARRGLSVFLLGGRPGVAEAAAARIARDVPGLRIAGTRDGYDGARDETETVAAINASGADVLFVAMGVPLQDLWIERNLHRLAPRAAIGVGALFDFWAGRVRRAPRLVRACKAEWLWRLAMEPRRLAGRYLIGNARFLARAVGEAARPALPDLRDATKRALDVLGAGAGLVMLAPVFAGLAGAIALESRGPVFFRQTRIGKDGTPFTVWKFRSMYRDAEARRQAILAQSDRAGLCFKAKADPRITRVGRVLRRTSLDELPQLINVVLGEMSLVGPRPALPEEVAAYPERARTRLKVKPGITGLWQVSGRADVDFDKMIDLDLAYVRSRSLVVDLMMLCLTVRAVVGGRGAY